MRQQLILGTVQLGMQYGINNSTGQPDREQAFEILNYAMKHGIKYIDTAAGYGNSETIIGEYHSQSKDKFKVCTKLPVKIEKESDIRVLALEAIKRLHIGSIDTLYLHRYEQCQDSNVMQNLIICRREGLIERIGISIYEPKELEYILEHLSDIVDVVQIPYNILDNSRWEGLINQAHSKEIRIFTRSVFLQGLLFKNKNDVEIHRLGAEKYLEFVTEYAREKNVSIAQVLLDFNRASETDGILVGCETIEQLQYNINCFSQPACISTKERDWIRMELRDVPHLIIDPRKW